MKPFFLRVEQLGFPTTIMFFEVHTNSQFQSLPVCIKVIEGNGTVRVSNNPLFLMF